MSMAARNREIVNLFAHDASWEEKYRRLIQIGKELPQFPEMWRTEDYRVRGCQSQVWLHAERLADGRIEFQVESDALIVKGLAALLVRLYSGATAAEILATSPDFVAQLDLGAHLSPSRANGLYAMVKQIKYYAAAYQALPS